MAEFFPEKSRWYWNEQVCEGVKRFEQLEGLDTTLYKNVPLRIIYACDGVYEYSYLNKKTFFYKSVMIT